MTFNEFRDYIFEKVMERMGDSYVSRTCLVNKNNGCKLTGISVAPKGALISPTLYIEDFYDAYERGATITELIDTMVNIFLKSSPDFDVDPQDLKEHDKMKHRIMCKLVNYSKNKELINEAPHVKIMDLCILFYFSVCMKNGEKGSIVIKNEIFDNWNISVEDLLAEAVSNTYMAQGIQLLDMNDLLKESIAKRRKMIGSDTDSFCDYFDDVYLPMYVLTSRDRTFGATCLLFKDEIADIASKLETDLYILPSSIHELIIIPACEVSDPITLYEMVKEVNVIAVSKEEVLSDNIYKFNRVDDKIYSVYSA